jgi:hypothetical protein
MKLKKICESSDIDYDDYETLMQEITYEFSDIHVDNDGSTIPVTLEQPQKWIDYISSGGKNVPNTGLSIKLGYNGELPHETLNVNLSLIDKFHTVLGNVMGVEITEPIIENFVVGADEEGTTNTIELSDLSPPRVGLVNFILPSPEFAYWFTVGSGCDLTKTRFFGKTEGTEVSLCFDKNEKVDLRVLGSVNVKFEIYFTKNSGEVKFANNPISLIDCRDLKGIDPPFDFAEITNPVAKDDGNFYLLGSVNSKIPALIDWVRNHKTLPVCFTFNVHKGLSYSTRNLVQLLSAAYRQTLFKKIGFGFITLASALVEMEKEFKELMEEYDDTEIIEHFEEKYGESIRV